MGSSPLARLAPAQPGPAPPGRSRRRRRLPPLGGGVTPRDAAAPGAGAAPAQLSASGRLPDVRGAWGRGSPPLPVVSTCPPTAGTARPPPFLSPRTEGLRLHPARLPPPPRSSAPPAAALRQHFPFKGHKKAEKRPGWGVGWRGG